MGAAISNKITKYEFIMSVLVILVHSLSNIEVFADFINKYIQTLPVTPFFIISGYFIMRNTYSPRDVSMKVNRKFNTLFIPYLLWNLIYYVFYLIFKPGTAINLYEIVEAALSYKYNPAFWFVYQLIFLTIISPLLFYTLKSWKGSLIMSACLVMLVMLGIDVPLVNEDALIYFYLGCIIAKYFDYVILSIKNVNACIASGVFSIGLFFIKIACEKLASLHIYFYHGAILSTILIRISVVAFIFFIIDYIIKYDKVPEYMRHNFFLYATHYIIIRIVAALVRGVHVFSSFGNDFVELFKLGFDIAIFLLAPVLCIYISIKLYKLLERKAPKALNYLTGGR